MQSREQIDCQPARQAVNSWHFEQAVKVKSEEDNNFRDIFQEFETAEQAKLVKQEKEEDEEMKLDFCEPGDPVEQES